MKRIIVLTLFLLGVLPLSAQKTDYPLIGAQVFIEEGQRPEQIENWFRILHDNGMEVCRIRMFEGYMKKVGKWDFSLFDTAFDAAEKYGIKIFATLFPAEDGDSGIGGFKYPRSDKQIADMAEYIRQMVSHFKDHPALYCWVLQNEPGGNVKSLNTPYHAAIKAAWKARRPRPEYDSDGYLKADFSDQWFVRWYMADFLRSISDEIRKWDPDTPHHINPHQVFRQLPEYDFEALSSFINSMGASMHPSWHFELFERREFPLAVAITSDLMRNGAIRNPFWITELQGGNNLYSGTTPMCPTAEETAQWLWSGITSGAEGVIFWCLNPRASCKEGGEWAMLTLQDEASDRLTTAAEVVRCIRENKEFFRNAKPVESDITLMYNPESYFVQAYQTRTPGCGVREVEGPITALIADYQVLSEMGIKPRVSAMSLYDWDMTPEGRTIVLPNMVSLPSSSWDRLETFVRRGGRLVMTSMSGFFDENAHCILLKDSKLKRLLGADLSEYKLKAERFDIDIAGERLPVSYWKGLIKNDSAEIVADDADGITMVRNRLGKGEVLWCPSMLEHGGWHADNAPLAAFMARYVVTPASYDPVTFAERYPNVLIKSLESDGLYMTFVCNKNGQAMTLKLKHGKLKPRTIYGENRVINSQLMLAPEESVVILWS